MAPSRHLVITADDFGIGSERDNGIVECYKAGSITRTSLLVNGVSTKSAINMAKQVNLPMGLHLNLTEGKPICKEAEVATLLGKEGFFLGKMGFREALSNGTVHHAQMAHEIRAQIQFFLEQVGSDPNHVDGHQHIHVLPGVRDAFASTLSQYGINQTRLPVEDVNVDWIEEPRKAFYTDVVNASRQTAQVLERHSIRFTNSFVGMTTMGHDMTLSRLKEALSRALLIKGAQEVPKDTQEKTFDHTSLSCELMVHPGYPCTSGHGGCGDGPDDFTKSTDREYEMNILMDKELLNFYSDNKIQLCQNPSCQNVKGNP